MNINKPLRYLYAFLLIVILSGCTHLNTTETKTARTQQNSETHTLDVQKHNLWRVNGQNNTLYLMGSIHVLTPDHYPLPQPYIEAFNAADKVVFEYDEATTNQEEVTLLTQQLGLYLDGSKLSEHIDVKDYKKASSLFSVTGLPPQMLDVMEPWLSYITISMHAYQELGYTGEHGIETYFQKLALDNNKPTSGLETAAEQIKILDGIPHASQVQLLIESLEKYSDAETEITKLDNAWKTADSDVLNKELIEEVKKYPAFYQDLIVKRNNKWLVQIKHMLTQDENILIIAGALHMYGDDGLVTQLKQQGYNVEQL